MRQVTVEITQHYELEELRRQVAAHFKAFGLKEKLPRDGKVVLKPNLLMKRRPEEATTTHPSLVEAVILELRALGAGEIVICDSPGGPYTRSALEGIYRASGLEQVAQRCHVTLNYDTGFVHKAFLEGEQCREFNLIVPLAQGDFIINLPKMKTHGMTAMSGAVKNLFGSVPGLQKPELHFRFSKPEEFCNMLVDLSLLVRPDFTIVDGVVAMEGDGPSGGQPRQVGVTLASDDLYSLDRVLCSMMGFAPQEVPTVAAAIRRGLCPSQLEEIEIRGDGYRVIDDFKRPKGKDIDFFDHLPGPLRMPLTAVRDRWLAPRPIIRSRDCVGCGKCAESCPPQTIKVEQGKAVIDYSRCIRCFCCHEMCPVRAIHIRRVKLFEY